MIKDELLKAQIHELFNRIFDDNQKFTISLSLSYSALNFTLILSSIYLYIALDTLIRQGIFARSLFQGEYEMRLPFLYVFILRKKYD